MRVLRLRSEEVVMGSLLRSWDAWSETEGWKWERKGT